MASDLIYREDAKDFVRHAYHKRYDLLMNCLWYEEIAPAQLADALGISEEKLFDKIFEYEDFTLDEIEKITAFLGLTAEEVNAIFF